MATTTEKMGGSSRLAVERSLTRDALRRLVGNRLSFLGLVIAILTVLLGLFGPSIAPYDYTEMDLLHVREPPSIKYWLGTDEVGRDLLSRVLVGARTGVFVGLFVSIATTGLGVLVGAISAYAGGWLDNVIMRLTDIIMSFPGIVFAAFINATLQRPIAETLQKVSEALGVAFLQDRVFLDYVVVLSALVMVQWPDMARLVRGQILSLREKDFVLAAHSLGTPGWQIIRRHLIPNTMGPIIVAATVGFGTAVLTESSLSYLGLGIRPPGASWGQMIFSSMNEWQTRPHLVAVPAITLAICVFGFNFLGDGLNDALNPRQARR